MPYCQGLGRLIACDLIGMGDSDKLTPSGPDRYTYAEQRSFLHALWEELRLGDKVILVVHDWGSALGLDWARHNPDRVEGIAYMEGFSMPLAWSDFPVALHKVFGGFRSPAGEDMVLEKNVFVERVLTGSILRQLTDEEMTEYRRPFVNAGEDRRPTLTWPRQIPLDGTPADVAEVIRSFGIWLATSQIPKLFVNAEPGAILTGRPREACRSWPNQTEITVKGSHFIQEDSPDEIGQALGDFVRGIRQR
jgi:haloalkane dehalogenase